MTDQPTNQPETRLLNNNHKNWAWDLLSRLAIGTVFGFCCIVLVFAFWLSMLTIAQNNANLEIKAIGKKVDEMGEIGKKVGEVAAGVRKLRKDVSDLPKAPAPPEP
jgi:hypothetical protein